MTINDMHHEILLGHQNKGSNLQAKTLWINLISPSAQKIQSLLTSLDLPRDALNQPRGSLKKRIGDVLLLKLEIPKRNLPYSDIPYQVSMLTILVKDHKVVTILEEEASSSLLMHLEHEYLVKWAVLDVTSFVYRLLALTTESFLIATKEIHTTINVIEDDLKTSFNNKAIYKLINHNKSFLFFAKSLKRNYHLLEIIHDKSVMKADHEQDLILSDLIVETAQAESLARIYNANLRNLMDAYSALIENNLSLSVQYLTIFVTISAIPLSVAGIYGMNTPLPFQNEPNALIGLGVMTLFIIVGALGFFKVKKMI